MQALILTGGLGTRLRPFTLDTPKPLLPVANRPFLLHQFDLLRRHGIRKVTLATAYRPETFRRMFAGGARVGLDLRYAREKTPLGTGGAVRNAVGTPAGTLLVLNGDVLHDLDLRAFLARHRNAHAEASIALTRVQDPTLYGLVDTDGSGRIRRFLEKPSQDEITCDTINAGAYLFEPSALDLIPAGVPYSLERGLFPRLLQEGRRMHGFLLDGYWTDIGTVDKYLQVNLDALSGASPLALPKAGQRGALLLEKGARLGKGVTHEEGGRTLLGAGCKIGEGVRFLGSVCVGAHSRIGRGALLRDCVILEGATVGEGARLERCIIGRGSRVGADCTVGPGTALGAGSSVSDFSRL
ncbi:MAG: NDP-sugar synthase [Elusimicrobiota bacterium]